MFHIVSGKRNYHSLRSSTYYFDYTVNILQTQPDLTGSLSYFTSWLIQRISYVVNYTKMYDCCKIAMLKAHP